MKYSVAIAASLAVLWVLLSGIYDKWLLWFFGVFSVLFATYFARRLGVDDSEGAPIDIMPGIVVYWAWLLLEIGKANVVVARNALNPTLDLSPKCFWVPAEPKSDLGLATLANSITLTPGTVSVDVRSGRIFVHALTEEVADPAGIAEMGRRIAKLEGGASGGAS